MKKTFTELSVNDISKYPIWRFTNSHPEDELEIESVTGRVFHNLKGLIISSKVTFSDGSTHLALFQNVSLAGQKVNDHFLSLSVERNGEWFPLAQYHNPAIEKYGPLHLAAFMGKTVDDVFPIKYDLREVLNSNSPRLVGIVCAEPPIRLTDEEIISLALEGLPKPPLRSSETLE